MSRTFSEIDKKIFLKLMPEVNVALMSEFGHNYPFILRPLSHKFSKNSEDFKLRILRLNKEELNYLVDLILCDKEELNSLEEEDMEIFLDIVETKLNIETRTKI